MATREQVLAAYAANPRAELNPSEEAIQYWQGAGLGSFNSIVDAVRAENPELAAQIDTQRNAVATTGGATTGATTGGATTGATTGGNNAFNQIVTDAYRNIGRTGIGTNANQIDPEGYNYWLNELNTGRLTPSDFNRVFGSAVSNYLQTRPTDPVSQVVSQYRPFTQPLPPTSRVPTTPTPPATPTTGAFASPGLAGNFANYTSIPIGAQYNPGVTVGGQSPYSQIMAQTPGFVNPYANVVAGLPMGGYNPNIYDPNLLSNFVADRAAERAGQAAVSPTDMGGFDGGLITKVMGPKPPTPDDGTMFVQKGEYIIKRDSVDKYGKGLLDMINEGKIPAKKIKSLLD